MKNTNIFDFDSKLKEEVEFFLLEWAEHFRKNILIGNLDDGVRMMLDCSRNDFEKKLDDLDETKNVLNYLERLKRYGKRPISTIEIASALDNNVSERAVQKQIQRLKHWKQIKETKVKLKNKDLLLYSAN